MLFRSNGDGLVITGMESGYLAVGGLPAESAAVVVTGSDGKQIWQTPIGGLALLDISAMSRPEVTVLDAQGQHLLDVTL